MSSDHHTLFSDLSFCIAPTVEGGESLRSLLASNGGRISDDAQDENALYVIDSFDKDNEAFADLVSKGARIISPQCIYDSISENKPLPDVKYPLFARCLEGVRVAFDDSLTHPLAHPSSAILAGNSNHSLEQLSSYVRYLGGRIVEAASDELTHLIATRVGSLAYRLAADRSVPILLPRWIAECWHKSALAALAPFLTPPFAGLMISVTGLSASTRAEVQRLTEAYGGEYTPNLTKTCTHLLAASPTGIKYRYALEWGVHCVTTPWFFDSINLRYCADETRYFVPMTEGTKAALFHPLSTSSRDFHRLSPALRRKHLMAMSSEMTRSPSEYKRTCATRNDIHKDDASRAQARARARSHSPTTHSTVDISMAERVRRVSAAVDAAIKFYSAFSASDLQQILRQRNNAATSSPWTPRLRGEEDASNVQRDGQLRAHL